MAVQQIDYDKLFCYLLSFKRTDIFVREIHLHLKKDQGFFHPSTRTRIINRLILFNIVSRIGCEKSRLMVRLNLKQFEDFYRAFNSKGEK